MRLYGGVVMLIIGYEILWYDDSGMAYWVQWLLALVFIMIGFGLLDWVNDDIRDLKNGKK